MQSGLCAQSVLPNGLMRFVKVHSGPTCKSHVRLLGHGNCNAYQDSYNTSILNVMRKFLWQRMLNPAYVADAVGHMHG